MITGDNIIWLLAIVIVSFYTMIWANTYRYLDKLYIKLLAPAPESWPPFLRVVFNLGKLSLLVGFGLQIFYIAFAMGTVMAFLGIALIIYAKNNIKNEERPP